MKIYVVTDLMQTSWDIPSLDTNVFKTRLEAQNHCIHAIEELESNWHNIDHHHDKNDDNGEYYRSDEDGIIFEQLQITEHEI